MGNNTLFRIGTKSGWCTDRFFLGSPFTEAEHSIIEMNDVNNIWSVRDTIQSCISRLQKRPAQLLWALSVIKMGRYGGSLTDFGGIDHCTSKGIDQIVITYSGKRKLVLRVKRKGKHDNQKDLIIMEVE